VFQAMAPRFGFLFSWFSGALVDMNYIENGMKYKQKYSREHRNIVKPNLY
jgi:hypothetical protein